MISNEEIEEAAKKDISAFATIWGEYNEGYLDGFKAGAHYTIEQFLKGLWHDAKEEPEESRTVAYLSRMFGEYCIFTLVRTGSHSWNEEVKSHGIDKWLYVDDLLRQKGENNNGWAL